MPNNEIIDLTETTLSEEQVLERLNKYPQIVELYNYCIKIGIEATLYAIYDGFLIKFNNGGDIAQHHGTYGREYGCVEPNIGCKDDFRAISLAHAKGLVNGYKEKLNRRHKK